MLLEPLTDALELVRNRIKDFEHEFVNNETQTRLSLVDPVLKALGWDPQDPLAVRVEFPVRQRNRNNVRVDYALLDSEHKPIAFVEAKKVGTNLGFAQDQLFEYGTGESVPYAIATNGVKWAIYKRERQGVDLLFKQLLAVSIMDQHPTLAAIKLLSLWKGLLSSQNSIDHIAPALNTLETHPLNTEKSRGPVSAAETESRQEQAVSGYIIPKPSSSKKSSRQFDAIQTFNLSNPPSVTGTKPKQLLLPGIPAIDIKNWTSLLTEVVLWLIETNRLTVDIPWRDGITGNRAVLQEREIIGSNNMKIEQQVEIKPGLFLLRNFSSTNICIIAAKLLEDCGIQSSEVKVTLVPREQ